MIEDKVRVNCYIPIDLYDNFCAEVKTGKRTEYVISLLESYVEYDTYYSQIWKLNAIHSKEMVRMTFMIPEELYDKVKILTESTNKLICKLLNNKFFPG